MWRLPPDSTFTVKEDSAKAESALKDIFAPSGGWSSAKPASIPWTEKTAPEPSYRDDVALKNKYGIELAKASNPFEAACVLFEDTSQALWVSVNWINDPICIAAKDVYISTVALSMPPLDKAQLAAKVLALSEEKVMGRAGQMVPAIEAKDRINALKLYSEIMGYTGKIDINASSNSFTHNEIVLKLVKAEDKSKPVVINQVPNVKSEITKEHPLVNLKLIGGKG